jgi:DNA-binding FrmR family transcriptional regulator
MAHTKNDKERLIGRIRRIKGQVEALERAVNEERDCSSVLQLIAAARGAVSGLMAEVVEGHIRHHVLDPEAKPSSEQAESAEELIDVLKTYLK